MDIQLYNQIVTKHANTVFKIAYNYCKNKYDAEDVVQNTFLKLLQRKDGFTDEEHIKRWLIRVAIKEISQILHIKETTIQTRLMRARAQLKNKLKGDWLDE